MKTKAIPTPQNWKTLKPHPLSELVEYGVGIDLNGMAAHMRQHGYDEGEPIILFEDRTLDGRHRLLAAVKAGVVPTFREFVGPDAMAYVAKKLLRQHLDTSQRAMLAAKLSRLPPSPDAQICASPTMAQAAETMHVSLRSVTNAAKVLDHGTPELSEAVSDETLAVSDAAAVATQPADVQKQAVEAVRKGVALTAAEVARLPFDGRLLLVDLQGSISVAAARSLLQLDVYNRVATVPPLREVPRKQLHPSHWTWYDNVAKKILWRPGYARTDQEIAFGVDSALYDLWELEESYAGLPEDEARRLAEEDMRGGKNRDSHGLVDPIYWWGWLWTEMRPNFVRLSEGDRRMVGEAADRYRTEIEKRKAAGQ